MRMLVRSALGAVFLLSPFGALAQDAASGAPAATPWIALVRVFVTDLDKSEAFYRDVFGMSAPEAYGEHERVFTLSTDPNGARFVLALTETPRANGSFALIVPDIESVFAKAPAAGGAVERPVQESTAMPVKIGFITDPDGASIEVIQPTAP